jgi:hypothetical protein
MAIHELNVAMGKKPSTLRGEDHSSLPNTDPLKVAVQRDVEGFHDPRSYKTWRDNTFELDILFTSDN